MQVDTPDQIRNLALAGHHDTGKTTLASALLYAGGAVNRMSKVEDGNTLTDFDAEEIARGISIGLATCFTPWRGPQGQPPRQPRLRHLLHRDPGGDARRRRRPALRQRGRRRRGDHREVLDDRRRDGPAGPRPPDQDGPRAGRLRRRRRPARRGLRARAGAGADPDRRRARVHRRRRPGERQGLHLPERRRRQGRGGRTAGRPRRRLRGGAEHADRGGGGDRRRADGEVLRGRHPRPGGPGPRPLPRRGRAHDLPGDPRLTGPRHRHFGPARRPGGLRAGPQRPPFPGDQRRRRTDRAGGRPGGAGRGAGVQDPLRPLQRPYLAAAHSLRHPALGLRRSGTRASRTARRSAT